MIGRHFWLGRLACALVAVFALTVAAAADVTAPDYYVATDGDDTNGDGTAENPFATPQRAVTAITNAGIVVAGVVTGTVHLAAGTWKGTDAKIDLSGITARVWVIGAGRDETVLDADGTTIGDYTVEISPYATVQGVRITGNKSTYGVSLMGGSGSTESRHATLLDAKVDANNGGIMLANNGSYGLIDRCQIVCNTNTASGQGRAGGVFMARFKSIIRNSLVAKNRCEGSDWCRGGGLYVTGGGSAGNAKSILHCTIVDNFAAAGGGGVTGGICCYNDLYNTMCNTIVRGNTYGTAASNFFNPNAYTVSCMNNWHTETSVNDGDTAVHDAFDFVDEANFDYRPAPGACVIGAGTAPTADETDLDGNVRPAGVVSDIGCCEVRDYGVYYVATDGDDENGDGTAENPFATPQRAVTEIAAIAYSSNVIYIAEGVYSGLSSALDLHAQSDKTIAVLGAGAATTVLDFSALTSGTDAVTIGPNDLVQGVTITGCARTYAVSMYASSDTVRARLFDCVVRDNDASAVSSSQVVALRSPTTGSCQGGGWIERCEIRDNKMQHSAVYSEGYAMLLRNTLVANNTGSTHGGVCVAAGSGSHIEYCTVTANAGSLSSGIYAAANANIVLLNTIVKDNTGGDAIPYSDSGYFSAATSVWSTAAFTSVPKAIVISTAFDFADAANGNYRLAADTCCVDAGTDLTGSDADGLDLDGNSRVLNFVPDIGCYEYATAALLSYIPTTAYVQDGLILHLDGIENVGRLNHAAAPAALVDLAQNRSIALAASEISTVTANAVTLKSHQLTGYFSSAPQELTLEVFMKPTKVPENTNYRAAVHVAGGYASLGYGITMLTMTDSGMALTAIGKHSGKIFQMRNPAVTKTTCYLDATPAYRYTEFVTASSANPAYYVNGTNYTFSSYPYYSVSGWGYSNDIWVGNDTIPAFMHSVRVYSRVLTEAERCLNDALDRMRFEGATSNDTGYAYVDGEIYARVAVTARYGAEVKINGGDWVAAGEAWCPTGDVVTVQARTPDGVALTWPSRPDGTALSDDGYTLTVTSSVPVAVTADAGDTVTWNETSTEGRSHYWDEASYWTCSDGVTHRVPQKGDAIVIPNNYVGIRYGNYTITVTNALPRFRNFQLGLGRWLTFKCGWTNKLEVAEEFIAWGATHALSERAPYQYSYISCSGGFTDTTMSNRVWIVARDFILSNEYVHVSADGGGYGKCSGPAWTSGSKWSSACAPHGGKSSTGGGTVYGSITEPTDPGSGSYHTTDGVSGGGAVRIQATNVVINGSITSTGRTVMNGWAGGAGSGGAVFISCKTVSGSGSVSATGGGSLTNKGGKGAGGGGRIAVHYDTAAQDAVDCGVAFGACGGTDLVGGTRCEGVGDAGSVYFSDDRFLKRPGRLVSGFVYYGPDVTLANELVGENLSLTNSLVEIGEGGKVCVTGNLDFVCSNTRASGLHVTGRDIPIEIGGSLSLEGARLYAKDGATVSVGGDLTMVGNSSVHKSAEIYLKASPTNGADRAYGATLDIGGAWTFGTNAVYYPLCNSTNGSIVAVTAGSLWMDSTAIVDANSAGWEKCKGPGSAQKAAGHGGKGGNGGGKTYDSERKPVMPGSGSWSASYGQPGGGVIYISTRGAMTLGGTFSANGASAGSTQYGAGPGSGGSVYLTSGGRLSGTATITANGGDATSTASGIGSGGGGRIAIWYRSLSNDHEITATAAGGQYGSETERTSYWGDDGTVYWRRSPLPGMLLFW